MSHKSVTHSQPIPMPKHTNLLKRNGRFYLNVRVPKDLRAVYKVEIIRKSLKTSNRRDAISQLHYEVFALYAEFAAKRRERVAAQPLPTIRSLSDREAHELVFRWLVEREKLSEEWHFETCCKMEHHERQEVLDNLRTDELVYSGGNKVYRGEDASDDLDAFLKLSGLECPTDSSAYRKLVFLFTKARLENVRRDMARVGGSPIVAIEPLFRDVFAHIGISSPMRVVSVGEMLQRFLKALKDGKRSEGTLRTYEVPCRLLNEFLGERTPVTSVTKEKIGRLFELLRKAPSNATKRYPRLTLGEAVEVADNKGDPRRLGVKTLENYYNNIVAIFNFAVEQEMIAKNPAKDKWIRASFERKGPPKKKALFTMRELNLIFHTPLFSLTTLEGSSDGLRKRKLLCESKAWVMILSLFHGLRSNEACQIHSEDVKTEDGIPYIEVREEQENESVSEKRLKNEQSIRRVPLHPEVLKMGFLWFVQERLTDTSCPRLFSDLTLGKRGDFSSAYGKWFKRFVVKTAGESCKATFHSFRHQWTDALREARVPEEDRERLGGWRGKHHSSERDYGRGPSLKLLRLQIQKLKYPKIDLSHLHKAHV